MNKSICVQTNIHFKLSKWEWRLSQHYAKNQIESSYSLYKKRGAPSKQKMLEDIAYGKGAEIAAYHILKQSITHLSQPDFQIYTNSNKSYDPDIQSIKNKINVHVKSTANYHKPSWLFSKKDPATFQNLDSPGEAINIASLFVISPSTKLDWSNPPEYHLLYLVNLNEYNQMLTNNNKTWSKPYSPLQQKYKLALYPEDLL